MGRRENCFDVLRLVLASAVIFGHSPELIDGNRSREPLTRLFGTISLGELAVCGFFILSGFLITQSWKRSPGLWAYARNRILRIYPAFLVAFAICALVVAPLAGARLGWRQIIEAALLLPASTPAFAGSPSPLLNGAVWTIHWEAICYLLVPLCAPFLRTRLLISGAWITLAALVFLIPAEPAFRFPLMFLSGACLYLAPPGVRLWPIALAGLVIGMFSPLTAWIALAVFGAYLLIGLAQVPVRWRLPDVSYGLFLYGWPVQKLAIWWGIDNPWLVALISWLVAAALGAASWYGVERYAMRLKTRSPVRASNSYAAVSESAPR